MDLSRLQYFVSVTDAGSFSQAAASLHLSQPALSRQVLLLEQELGQRLLVRTGRGVEVTPAGKALLGHARGIFSLADAARADMQDRQVNQRGRVVIGLPPRVAHVLAADVVERFRAEAAEAVITIEEGLSVRLREWLLAGRLDAALLFDPPNSPLLQLETIAREPLVLVGATPLPPRLSLAEAAQYALVMPSGPNALRQLLDKQAAPRGLTLRVVAEVDSVQTVLSLVARGVACTVLPVSALRLWHYDTTPFTATLYAPMLRNRLVLAVPKAKPATRLTQTVIALLRQVAALHFAQSTHATDG